jgi:capsular polysaccharide biosynthesis protein
VTEFLGPGVGSGDAGLGVARAVKARPLVVLLLALVTAGAAAVWLAGRPREYRAVADILVTPAADDGQVDRSLPLLRTSTDPARVVQTAAALVDSRAAERLTARTMGPGWTAARVAGAVRVTPASESDVVAVTAEDPEPSVAARLATTFAGAALHARAAVLRPRIEALVASLEAQLRAERTRGSALAAALAEQLSELRAIPLDRDPTLSLSRSADVPDAPAGPPRWLLFALACAAGLAVAVGVATVLEWVRPARVADAAEARAAAGAPVLALIPRRAGRHLRGTARVRRAAFRFLQLQLELAQPPWRVVWLASASSAREASGCVTSLCETLANAGHTVLLVDLVGANRSRAPRSAAPARVASGPDRELDSSPIPGLPGAESLRIREDGQRIDLPAVLTAARASFEHVLVQAPPLTDAGEVLRAVPALDAVLLVVRPRVTRFEDLRSSVDLLQHFRGRPDGLVVVGGPRGGEPIGRPSRPAQEEAPPARRLARAS